MGKTAFNNTSFEKKILFTRALSEALGDFPCPINARFDWSKPDRVFSAKWKNCSVSLSINLNTDKDPFFRNSSQGSALAVLFRANFISHFFRALEAAEAAPSGGYFEGMAKLDAILCRLTKKTFYGQLPSPNAVQSGLQLLDLQAACRAMTRMLTNHHRDIQPQDRDICNRYVNTLLDFSLFPEVCFSPKRHPRYLCTEGIRKLEYIVKEHPEAIKQFSLLSSWQGQNAPISLQSLNRIRTETGSPFFRELLLRCGLLTGLSPDSPELLQDANAYRERALQWIDTYVDTPYILLRENREIICCFLQHINRFCRDTVCPTSGNLHIY